MKDLKSIYASKSVKELVFVLEEKEYLPEVIKLVRDILSERKVDSETLEEYSKSYYTEYFKTILNNSVLTSVEEFEIPKSEFLSRKQLIEIYKFEFHEMISRRSDFYRNLPKAFRE